MSKATINKFSDIVERCEPIVDKFEKQYNVDLHLDLNMDKIKFVHKEYGNLNRFSKEEFPIAQLNEENVENLTAKLKDLVKKATDDLECMNILSQLPGHARGIIPYDLPRDPELYRKVIAKALFGG